MREHGRLPPQGNTERPHEEEKAGKESAFAGLPSAKEVAAQLRRIEDPISIRTEYGRPLEFGQSRQQLEFPAESYKTFIEEYRGDAAEFARRLQRLKMRAMRTALRGVYAQEKSPAEALTDLTLPFLSKRKKQTRADEKNIIAAFNALVEPPLQLSREIPLSHYDIAELCELSHDMSFGPPPERQKKKIAAELLDDVAEMERAVAGASAQGELFASDGAKSFVSEKKIAELRRRYRDVLRAVADNEELGQWYSPTYGASGKGQHGAKQRAEPMRNDYQRFRMTEAEALERRLNEEYFETEEPDWRIESLLFPSGLNAFDAVLDAIDQGTAYERRTKSPPRPVLRAENVYFEVDHLVDKHYENQGRKVEKVDAGDIDALIARVKADLPEAVFLNPMTNGYAMKITEVGKLIAALNDARWINDVLAKSRLSGRQQAEPLPITIVIDNSTLGRLATWRDAGIKGLPPFVKIVSVESLIKYAQDGQELAAAGLVTAIGEDLGSTLEGVRMANGLMPTENAIRRLTGVAAVDQTDRNLARHSRNALAVAATIEQSIVPGASFVSEVVFPELPSHPQHESAQRELGKGAGGLFTMGINWEAYKNYRELLRAPGTLAGPVSGRKFASQLKAAAKAYVNLSIALAKEAGIELNQGTSYGFQTTRLAVYPHELPKTADPDDEGYRSVPYVRVAVGTENIKETRIIADVLKRANEIFSAAMERHELENLVHALQEQFTITLTPRGK